MQYKILCFRFDQTEIKRGKDFVETISRWLKNSHGINIITPEVSGAEVWGSRTRTHIRFLVLLYI